MTELKLKQAAIRMIKKEYPNIYFFKASDRFTSGILDLNMCVHGLFVAIELKTKKGRVTKLQEWTISEIKRCGGLVDVCRTVDEVRGIIKRAIRVTELL